MPAGRPKFEPTDAQRMLVGELAAFGVRQELISRRLGIDRKTLRKAFRRELESGRADATATVAESLFRKATGDGKAAVTACIFWLKTQAGWREVTVNQNQTLGADGQPINPPIPDFGISFANGGPGQSPPDAPPAADIEDSFFPNDHHDD